MYLRQLSCAAQPSVVHKHIHATEIPEHLKSQAICQNAPGKSQANAYRLGPALDAVRAAAVGDVEFVAGSAVLGVEGVDELLAAAAAGDFEAAAHELQAASTSKRLSIDQCSTRNRRIACGLPEVEPEARRAARHGGDGVGGAGGCRGRRRRGGRGAEVLGETSDAAVDGQRHGGAARESRVRVCVACSQRRRPSQARALFFCLGMDHLDKDLLAWARVGTVGIAPATPARKS